MQKISTFLWFNDNAEEAVNFYVSVFKDGRITAVTRYTEAGPGPAGSVMTIAFELQGQEFGCINGGPHFTFSEAISLVVHCKDQQEIDEYWQKLIANGGQESQCGWLKDKFGLSWQIVPVRFLELLKTGDTAKVTNMLKQLYTMKKLDISVLEKAYEEG